MEDSLLERQRQYNHMATTLPVILYDYILNSNGKNQFRYLAPSCYDLLELNEKDLLADVSLLWNIIHKDDLQRLQQQDAITTQHGETFNSEFRIITSSGQLKWIQMTSRINLNSPGKNASWSGFMLDITERKQIELTLKKNNQPN